MIRPDIEEISQHVKEPQSVYMIAGSQILQLCNYIEYLEAQDRRRDWPSSLHEQYLIVLDERDKLQEKIDEANKALDEANVRTESGGFELGVAGRIRLFAFDKTTEINRMRSRLVFDNDGCEHDWDVVHVDHPIGGPGKFLLCTKCWAEKDCD